MEKSLLESLSTKELLKVGIKNDTLRSVAFDLAKKRLHTIFQNEKPDVSPKQVQEDRYFAVCNLLNSLNRFIKKENISSAFLDRILGAFVDKSGMKIEDKVESHKEKFGDSPPLFLTISPEQGCNLNCDGCYAGNSNNPATLDYDVLSKIIREKEELWGSYFTVISGGEPLLYESQGKDIFDFFAEHDDQIYLMYTNGVLIDKEAAEKLAEVGNVLPAISVEGFKEETNARRGEAIYSKILQAFENLREAGVPFGISATASKENAETIVSDEFIDFYFKEQGAIFGWVFQYMPIGCSYTLDHMVTPDQRLHMLRREEEILRDKGIFYIDFWNSGAVSRGCISAGRGGGYFYINWNGDATPCVFYPYSKHNIYDVYENNGNLNTVWNCDFFKEIRNWQEDYGYNQPPEEIDNWIVPCPIRGHHEFAYNAVKEHGAEPIDPESREALQDDEYHRGLIEYGHELYERTKDIWQEEYLNIEQ